MRIALKTAYVGQDFFGSQRQPGKRTVEEELLKALEKCIPIDNFQSAGRTDRGVSALGMVFAFDCEKLNLNQLNHHLPKDMCCYAIARAPETFNPRFAKMRHYRYFLPQGSAAKAQTMAKKQSLTNLRAAARLLEGTHDFSNFCKKSERNPIRTMAKIKVSRTHVDFFSESFLWQQVRRMAYAIVEAGKGSETEDPFSSDDPPRDLFAPGKPVPPLPPENLLLVDIRYPKLMFETNERILSNLRSRMEKLAETKRVEHLIYRSFLLKTL